MRFECTFRFKYSHAFVNKYFEYSKASFSLRNIAKHFAIYSAIYICIYKDHTIIISYSKLSDKTRKIIGIYGAEAEAVLCTLTWFGNLLFAFSMFVYQTETE